MRSPCWLLLKASILRRRSSRVRVRSLGARPGAPGAGVACSVDSPVWYPESASSCNNPENKIHQHTNPNRYPQRASCISRNVKTTKRFKANSILFSLVQFCFELNWTRAPILTSLYCQFCRYKLYYPTTCSFWSFSATRTRYFITPV